MLHLQVQVQPGARSAGCAPHGDELLKVRVTARAVDGRANEALCAYLAERLGVSPGAVRIVRGLTARRKGIEAAVASFDPAQLLD